MRFATRSVATCEKGATVLYRKRNPNSLSKFRPLQLSRGTRLVVERFVEIGEARVDRVPLKGNERTWPPRFVINTFVINTLVINTFVINTFVTYIAYTPVFATTPSIWHANH